MSCETTTTALLRAGGFRATWQRQLIATALRHADGHKTAQQILDDIQAGHPTINASTIYRTLSSFRDKGLVSETDLGTGEASYAWLGDERHHHLICRECQVTIELGHASMEELRTAILLEHGFEATVDHFAIFGRCRECAASGAS
jgi:Fur family ferric uptake transcriptional regulator